MILKENILFSDKECQTIIENVKGWDDTIIGVRLDSNFDKNGGIMKSFNIRWNNDNRWIKDRIVNWVNKIDGVLEIDADKDLSAYYRKYVKGDYFIKHNDHINNGSKRLYTIGVMLHSSDDLIGGDLKFYFKDEIKKLNFEKGKVYIFDSNIPHSVDLIERGERITLMFFIEESHIRITLKTSKLI
jgi:predicted 2-oxoglutarate/Fe(II)-dependent dioxygenase YbiX